MTAKELQQKLADLGVYKGAVDGKFGPASKAALLLAFTDGVDAKLTHTDVEMAAKALGVNAAKIWTVWDVEASANPFIDGRPTILFEPHVFSRLTDHKFDASDPDISSRKWNKKLYAGSQMGRYNQLLKATALDADAGLSAASYGGFQILGSNFKVCGYDSPWDFVYSQSRGEKEQLLAFIGFVTGNGLKSALQKGDWAAFAKGYNGSAYRENKYDEKLAAAYAKRSK
jgi:hypothetical protein